MRKQTVYTICGMLFFFLVFPNLLSAQGHKAGVWDASNPTPFKTPAQFVSLLKDYRKNWIRLTNLEFSGLHWNQGVVVYVNNDHKAYRDNYIGYLTLLKQLEDDECEEDDEEEECQIHYSTYPPGTIILKENYLLEDGVPKQPLTVTIMIKHSPGYDSEKGDWQYLQYNTSGDIVLDGNSKTPATEACSTCHSNIADRDYVFSSFYHPQTKQPLPSGSQ